MDTHEVHTVAELDELLESGHPLIGLRIQGLDLTKHADALRARSDVRGLAVLGGRIPRDLAAHLVSAGAVVLPDDPSMPIPTYRAHLYRPEDLYAGLEKGYAATPDARAYGWSRDGRIAHDALVTASRALHDDGMTDALNEALSGCSVVGVMGGHALPRDSDQYAVAARLGLDLALQGHTVLTGGGPGAMEAAGLGASAGSAATLETALSRIAEVPDFRPDVGAWARCAFSVRDDLPKPSGQLRSVGVPTWFYGHEPPNVFCDGIAKYFSNALREDALLSRSTAGIIVARGAAGTVQEIFQAVTPLYYAAPEAALPHLILVGADYWQRDVPVWPAIQALSTSRPMAGAVHLVDTHEEALALLRQ